MNDATTLKSIMSSIDYKLNRISFLCYWLEDINFHTEAGKIAALISEKENQLENDLHALWMVSREKQFGQRHWDYVKDKLHDTYTVEQLDGYLSKLRNEQSVAMTQFVSARMFQDYTRAIELSYALAKIWGYGNSLKLDEIMELLAECDEIDKERVRIGEAYSRD